MKAERIKPRKPSLHGRYAEAVEALRYFVSEYTKQQPTWPLPDIARKAKAALKLIDDSERTSK